MVKMNKNSNQSTAWMIRTDGTAIPCLQHIYAGKENIDETLFAAEWLYQYTLCESTKILCLRLIKSYSVTLGKLDFLHFLPTSPINRMYF